MNTLFSRILVGIDGSEPSDKALAFAARLTHEHAGSLVLCHAVNWMPLVAQVESTGALIDPTPLIDGLREQGESLLVRAAQTTQHFGIQAERFVFEGDPAESILRVAAEQACGLIVMGTHGRTGLGRLLIGSTAEAVLRGSTIPVLTVRPDIKIAAETRRCFERIVVGIDDSELSDAAMETAFAFPVEDRRHVLLCSVADVTTVFGGSGVYYGAMTQELRREAQRIVDSAVASARAQGVTAEGRAVNGRTGTELLAAAHEQEADLIVVGSHGRRGLRRFFLGSVAENIVRSAPVPVLVVRTSARTPAATTSAAERAPAHV